MNRIQISQPKEGADTLVAQFAILKVLEVLERVKKLEWGDPSPRQIEEYLGKTFTELSPRMRKKIELLARGLTPPDDFRDDDCRQVTRIKDTILELELQPPRRDLQAGEMAYFRGKRWLITKYEGDVMTLKHI